MPASSRARAVIPDLDPIRIVLVDDSLVLRSVTEHIVAAQSDLRVVASLPGGQAAIDFLKNHDADIVLLDIEMPQMSGLAALPHLIAHGRGARVIILSSHAATGSEAAMEALRLGAVEALEKPGRTHFGADFSASLLELIRQFGRASNLAPRERAVEPFVRHLPAPIIRTGPLHGVVVGSSTGGIPALYRLLAAMGDARPAMIVTQHIPPNFVPFLAQQLSRDTDWPVSVIHEGMPVTPGHVFLAPGYAHATVVRDSAGHDVFTLVDSGKTARSAVDPLFHSAAALWGAECCGVILSGMGSDGADGARALNGAGALVLVQDVESSVVWGMPGSVSRRGDAHATLSPEEIAATLRQWVGEA